MSLTDRLLGEVQRGSSAPARRDAGRRPSRPHRVVDDLLPLLPGWPAGARVAFGPEQHVQVRYGSFHANARLQRQVVLRSRPVVTIELASQLVAWGLSRAPLPSFVQVSGRLVQVRLADIPSLSGLAPLWPHLAHATCTSTPSGLELAFGFHVVDSNAEAASAPRPRPQEDRPMIESGRLQSWIQQQLATGLPALAGARVAGTIPVPVTLLNDLIAQAVADAAAGISGSRVVPARGRTWRCWRGS